MEPLTRRTWLRALAALAVCVAPRARRSAGCRRRVAPGRLEIARPAGAGEDARVEVWRAGPRGFERLTAGALRRRAAGWTIAGLASGSLVVRVRWSPARGRLVVAEARVELGTRGASGEGGGSGERGASARPRVAPRSTRIASVLVEHPRRTVPAARALARPLVQGCRLLAAPGAGPPLDVELAVGGSLHVRGLAALEVSRTRLPGPGSAAPGWALRAGPRRASRRRSSFEFVDEVARTVPLEVVAAGVPADAHGVQLHARSDGWCAAPVTLARDGGWRGALGLVPGTPSAPVAWEVLARAFDAEGRATHAGSAPVAGAQAGVLAGGGRPRPLQVALAPVAALQVAGLRASRPGDAVRVRLAGWTLDLDAAPLGRDRRARLVGLVPGREHDVRCGVREQRVRAPGPGRTARVEL